MKRTILALLVLAGCAAETEPEPGPSASTLATATAAPSAEDEAPRAPLGRLHEVTDFALERCPNCGPVPDPWRDLRGPVPDPWHGAGPADQRR